MKTEAYMSQLKTDISLFLRVGADCEKPTTLKKHEEVLGYFLDQVTNYHEGIEELLEEKPKRLYWSVWFHQDEKSVWMHHGSYDSRADAQDEARRLRDGGEKVEVRRQEW